MSARSRAPSAPPARDAETIERERTDLAVWGDALRTVTERHELSGAPIAATSGTLPVFLVGDAVVKWYAPAAVWGDGEGWPDETVERATLQRVAGAVPAPGVQAAGELADWRYLVMDRVAGEPIERCLDAAPRARALDALQHLGRAVRALHQLDATNVPVSIDDFDAFLAGQHETVRARRRRMPDAWREAVARFVEDTPRGDARAVLLHTELGPAHALVDPNTLALNGIIDWVEAMRGDAEYDLVAVAFFITRGDGEALGAFLDGYDWRGPRGEALARRLMRYLLLHRYAPLSWLLERRPVPDASTVDDLLEPWIGFAP